MRVDLNADVGEGAGDDERLIPLVTSVNVACGGHAGDPITIDRTIRLALASGAAVGAHPGYPDPANFGRQPLAMAPDALEASLVSQIRAVADAALALDTPLRHVKPHGALYNLAARDPAVAATIARAIARVSSDLVLVGLAGSALLSAARDAGLRSAAEAFADRAYEADGSLRSRSLPGALLESPGDAAAQALAIVRDGRVGAHDGGSVAVRADTICIHGDSPGAVEFALAIRAALEGAGVTIAAPGT